jgi:cell pole-organizing protein PopZ
MSQAPAQREEPSMEDILSSIRKIIQSNDDSGEDASAPTEVVSEPLVEEVVAREPVEEAPVKATPLEPVPEIKVEPVQQQAPAVPEQSTVSDQGELTSAPERAREVVSAPETPVAQSEILEAVASEDATEAQASVNSALISAGPKAKVAASFAQLNEAITASSSQSLEEMANDLLKPMLQEWLDNNLPGLVEKLVREEIERVARGGQES